MHSSTAEPRSVQKVCRILSELTNPGPHRLSNIVANTRLNKATVLRLLESLIEDGFVLRDAQDKTYSLGNEALAMAAVIAGRSPFPQCAHPSVLRLAEVSGDSACLCILCGGDAVCIDREEGAYPLRANYVHVGRRLPLGVGSAGLVLLAWLPQDAIDRMMERNREALVRFSRLSAERIRKDARAARARGYALTSNVICEGTGGIAVPILDTDGRPVAALGVTAVAKRLVARQDMLARLLHEEAAHIGISLRQRPAMAAARRSNTMGTADDQGASPRKMAAPVQA
ncbi:IclR family transcriptional regulator [Verminephrobacter eiseniae]|uniref:Transcriptional regulator, IclR family n=1 Tax=Verminephrobacter eiseniae (strain EF01-2) TaxID=391735 RepID=A1WQ05_VEREI|nr:IclR family transcriptional regulator [Verminephrobacter eiseniae]ABM59712.1 transcriptional regulator, IclR family [Verminephrobacter eiseniae EF01-2]MCW5285231.1 IclR family transcriptional regulator [Verminephrobacter eiseniae]MCW5302939.1 IclR family transcriptional regulator [Verminephrobacter eiseniae]MCW8182485.1 IclR family transcriptional regulator [Verminephrobacter eiseniae]MCW8192017.1 IclR family transcriptional regulator [Verminephrobacter eiseniae]